MLLVQKSKRNGSNTKELLELLELYITLKPKTVWVFDAVDECTEPAESYTYISKLLTPPAGHGSVTKGLSGNSGSVPSLILFARPDIVLSRHLSPTGPGIYLHLDKRDNFTDIHRFTTMRLRELFDQGILVGVCEKHQLPGLVSKVASHSRGMFLWVKLLADYLASEILSPRDRLSLLDELGFVEGLDALYIYEYSRQNLPQAWPGGINTNRKHIQVDV